jgi:hypothetical protein
MSEGKSVEDNQEVKHGWTKDQALELWRHFAATGGADKNTMVTVTSWLLTFSGTIIGYIVTKLFQPHSFAFTERRTALGLAILGMVSSISAAYVAVLYGGYANRSWAEADRIAQKRGWSVPMPYGSVDEKQEQTNRKPSFLARYASRRARHTDHTQKVAPVFKFFAGLALITALVHVFFLIVSLFQNSWK